MATQHFSYRFTDTSSIDTTALAALATISELPKLRLKDAMSKGAVWLKRGKHTKRLRRATATLQAGDEVLLHYNPEILALVPPSPTLIVDEKHYSVWNKPAGLLAQGSQEGDHCSLLRLVELQLKREVFLVHRLDREASGLMLIAHTGKAAAALSALFAREGSEAIEKTYRIEVLGSVAEAGEISTPLDGKTALTKFTRIGAYPERNCSTIEVQLVTGRKHQIRRHFAEISHPVLGDAQYGSANKDPRGLQLQAVRLAFTCPFTRNKKSYSLL